MAELRYIGGNSTTFQGIGEVEPGDVFAVPDSEAEGYTRRSDVEYAVPPKESLKISASDPVPTEAPAAPAAK